MYIYVGIGAGEFTVCAQLKVLTTAGFSVIVLGTNLSGAKWRALGLLVLGAYIFYELYNKTKNLYIYMYVCIYLYVYVYI